MNTDETYSMLLLLILLTSLSTLRCEESVGNTVISNQANFYFDPTQSLSIPCTNNSVCIPYHFSARCNNTEGNSITPGVCHCNVAEGYYRNSNGDSCVYHSKVSETCDLSGKTTVCADKNSQCQPDSQGTTGISRCVCIAGTVLVRHNGTQYCAYPITAVTDIACTQCDLNQGTCFRLQPSGTMDGCACPPTFSGPNCSKTHVNVSCTIDQMKVCYLPHSNVNLTYALQMYSEGHSGTLSCRGVYSPSQCGKGRYLLVLPLRKALLEVCGTKVEWEENKYRYTNTIRVQLHRQSMSSDDIMFTTFCSFVSMHDMSFIGMKVNSYSATEIGQDIRPIISLAVRDHLGQYLREGVYYRVGDIVHINIYLNTNNGYGSMRIEDCTLSSSAVMPDWSATTMAILTNGCPTSGQSVLGLQNTFHKVVNKSNEWETGMVQLVKLQGSSTLHIHCRVKLCVKTAQESCIPHSCNKPERRRRAIETIDDIRIVDLHGAVKFADSDHNNVILGMSLSAIAFSILIFIFIVVLLVYIARQTQSVIRNKQHRSRRQMDFISGSRNLNFISRIQKKNLPSHMTESKI